MMRCSTVREVETLLDIYLFYNRPSEKTFRFLCSRRCSLLLVLVRLNMKSHFLLIYIYVNLLKTILCSTTMNQASTITFTHDNTYDIASPKNILLATHVHPSEPVIDKRHSILCKILTEQSLSTGKKCMIKT